MSDTGSIVGKVINLHDGQPLAGVSLKRTGEGTQSNATSSDSGDFQHGNLAPGRHELHAERTGFETETYGPLVVVADLATEIEIALRPASS